NCQEQRDDLTTYCRGQCLKRVQPGKVVGTGVTADPCGRDSADGLYGTFFVRMHHAIFVILCCFILCSTREHSFRPDRILPSPSRTVTVKDGASSAPPKACP